MGCGFCVTGRSWFAKKVREGRFAETDWSLPWSGVDGIIRYTRDWLHDTWWDGRGHPSST
jgi:hypothetical protein